MTRQQILEKAIQKAIEGGWKAPYERMLIKDDFWVPCVIFNHQFAKALWGEECIACNDPKREISLHAGDHFYRWESHLQQMVVSPDPIQYLGEHI